ncbi:MAG TPA: HAMP domain-containing sensor histidine kinase, partial [Ktedonobacteraceae bacterium]
RQPPERSCKSISIEGLSILVLSLVLSVVGTLLSLGVPPVSTSIRELAVTGGLGVVIFVMNCSVGIFGRVALGFALLWNRLRRQHLLWQLTHAHMLMLAVLAGFCIFVIDSVLVIAERGTHNILLIVPMTVLLVIFSVIVMIIIVSPIALFSYFVVRRATERLRLLTYATGALRRSNYDVRVPVVGEDEVAQLQADFNAMASELGSSMRALQEERDRVTALLQERRELIANVSHELRTPVATLRGYLETSLMHWDDLSRETLYHDLRVMESEAIQLQGRVEDLFTLARSDVGQFTLKREQINIPSIVHEVADGRAPLAWRSSKVEIVSEIPENVPVVLGDTRRLKQALQNLLHNGIRHTPPGGIVAIVVDVQADDVVIHVKDTGEGIIPEDLPHVWKRFYQSKHSRVRGGTGLGLALVKEWVEGMGGSVEAASVPSEGSCFTLCLPRQSRQDAREFPAQPLWERTTQELVREP